MDRLSQFAQQAGFTVSAEPEVVRAVGVPCLLLNGIVSYCTITKSRDPGTGRPTERIGGAVHAVRIAPDKAGDGLVYHADGSPIGACIGGDGQSWSNISIKKGSQERPEDDESACAVIHRYAKQIVGAASAADYNATTSPTVANPFNIPNTFEARAAISPVQNRVRGQHIAIIGLGGTGAYVLDILAKTPVSKIHLLDADNLEWHNFMRAPGALTEEEIKSQRRKPLSKVNYYQSKYAALRNGICAHSIRMDSRSKFTQFLSEHPIDYCFVCIDQQSDSDSPRQDVVYAALSGAGVPFVDSGVSITLEGTSVGGAVTTSAYPAGSVEWKNAIPNARVAGNALHYRNIQLPEVNALAAALAVMEWRRRTDQYVSRSTSFLHKFRIEKPHIAYRPVEERCR